jgi:hypothetical protein
MILQAETMPSRARPGTSDRAPAPWHHQIPSLAKAYRQGGRSVTLPAPVARQVDNIANRNRLSDNRVLVELIELGIEASKQKERAFFELAERFRASKDPDEAKQLGDKLGRFVFG